MSSKINEEKENKISIGGRLPESLINSWHKLAEKNPRLGKNIILEVAVDYFFSLPEEKQIQIISKYLLGG
jgi:hypothetical protein